MVCAKLKPAVSGLDKEFPGKVTGQNVDATTEEGKKAVQELGFRNHGLVIRDESGKALWKQPDHEVNMDDVRKALKDLTGTP
jgi:hypothetical protein